MQSIEPAEVRVLLRQRQYLDDLSILHLVDPLQSCLIVDWESINFLFFGLFVDAGLEKLLLEFPVEPLVVNLELVG